MSAAPMTRRIIRADGTEEPLERPMNNGEIAALIGAETLDVVSLKSLGDPLWVMLVDDAGYETREEVRGGSVHLIPTRARKPVNVKATALYLAECRGGTTHQVVGDVAIVPDQDYA